MISEKRRRQRAEDTESRRRHVQATNNSSSRADRTRETGGEYLKQKNKGDASWIREPPIVICG